MTELSLLVIAAQQGDKDAFGQIVNRFQDMAYASAYALVGDPGLAQDIAQEAFLDAYLHLAKLRDPAAFPGWFRRIVMGNSHRQIRSRPVAILSIDSLPLDDANSLYARLSDPAETLDERQSVQSAIGALPPQQRLAIALFYVEGYSQQEIAAFLEVPVSTVKKRLFDARHNLKERIVPTMQAELKTGKPSQNAEFKTQIDFFLALRDHDLDRIRKLIAQYPDLLQVQTEWKMALGHHYWPLGSTALHLTAATGDAPLLTYLLTQPIDVNQKNGYGMTALHLAAMMKQPATAQLLLDRGADVNARSANGQTPLHHAVLRNDEEGVNLLLTYRADPNLTDAEGRTAVDWAVMRQNGAMVDLLVTHGATRPATKLAQTIAPIASAPSAMLTTGIKIIDLLTPIPRGGQIGVFTPLAGVGLMVVLGQLIHSVSELYHGHTIWLFLTDDKLRAEDQLLSWRESDVDDKMTFVAGRSSDPVAAQLQTVKDGLQMAEKLRQQGQEILLMVDSRLALVEGVVPYLQTNRVTGSGAAITTLYHGHYTVGVEPAALQALDAVITFDYTRAKQRLYPAIDPVRSHSQLLQGNQIEPTHRQTAMEVKRLLQRYADLRQPMEAYNMGIDALWYIQDDPNLGPEINRARRLDRFLTQNFYGAEPWTGVLGELVSVEETVAGCRAILDGTVDTLPEDAFYFVGTLAQAQAKAKKG